MEALQNNPYIRCPVRLEQFIMEGSYNKVSSLDRVLMMTFTCDLDMIRGLISVLSIGLLIYGRDRNGQEKSLWRLRI